MLLLSPQHGARHVSSTAPAPLAQQGSGSTDPAEPTSALPILDYGQLLPGAPHRTQALMTLRRAARDPGFFYLENTGLDLGQQSELLALAARLFALDDHQKQAVQMVHSPHFRGYNRVGAELTRARPDWREQFDIMAEEPCLPDALLHQPWQRLQGPNLWPSALPELRGALLGWQAQLTLVGLTLIRSFAETLAQAADVFDESLSPLPYRHTKLIHYPGRHEGDGQGVGAHKDPGYLTLLLQDSHGGLEVLTEQGWTPAPPRAGALLVNIGELLELASNGYLKATLHRVVTPPPGVSRLSCAFFMAARLDATVPLLTLPPALATEARGLQSDPDNPLFYQVGENVLKGRLRSHPDVAARHYVTPLATASAPTGPPS
ncbi:MAG: 2-oxoglutarate and iron-dependent oxygenase domain-containing protein [Aeromonas molluscorum]